MATGGLYGNSSTGAIVASPGSESAGLYGSNVNFGGTFFQWFIFQQASTQPATPTGGSWNFTTQVGTPPSGWSNSPPPAPTNEIWVSIAFVNSRSTSTLTWSVPGLLGVIASVNVGTTTTGAAGSSASVANSGTPLDAILDFTIPRGDTGATGAAATIAAGTTTTTDPGTNATVTNVGTSGAAIFDFTIPRGAGVNSGGATGQVLAKASGTDYDTTWINIVGGLNYQGTWNASTNTPTLTSSVGTNGYYYVVNVAGSTNLDGITDWVVGDWAIFNGSTWQKIDQTNLVTSVNGQTGAVSLTYSDVGAFPATATTGSGNVVLATGATQANPTISNYENFTPIAAPTYSEGRVWYDSTAKALAYYNDVASAVVHMGHDIQLRVINNTGSTIANGAPVYISSTSSGQTYPNIALAKADVAATSAVIGLADGAIASGAVGYVTSQGVIDDVNTGSYTVGQVLYLSPYSAGQLMNTIPPTGITVQVGVVSYVNSSTGKIYVKQTTPLNVPASIISGQVAIANGGTGQSTANAAFNALAPSQTSNSGKYLTTDGTNTSWSTVASGAAISNDTSTATAVYPLFSAATSGTPTTIYTSNANYLYTPSTGELKAKEMVSSNGIVVNADSVTSDYTIATGTNGFSVGPLTIASGVSLTVASGQRHVVI